MSGQDEGKTTSSEGVCVTILVGTEELNLKIRCLHISGIDRVRQQLSRGFRDLYLDCSPERQFGRIAA